MTENVQNKVIIITGAARGLGFAIARYLAAAGAKIMLADIDAEALEVARQELQKAGFDDVEGFAADLCEQDGAKGLVNKTRKLWGEVDVLVNNAGGGVIRPFLQHDAASLKATIDRNLWTCIWCCHSVLPAMKARGYGRIINLGADSVRNGLDSHAGYNAAKGGMHGLTTGLAREFAQDGITVNTVAPCGILTPEIRQMLDPDSEVYQKHIVGNINELVGMIPMKRFAEMEEVASMVAYLASDEASFVTGQVISVNGGSTML